MKEGCGFMSAKYDQLWLHLLHNIFSKIKLIHLVSTTQYISQHLASHSQVDIIYSDLPVAFESSDYTLFFYSSLVRLNDAQIFPKWAHCINYVHYTGFCSNELVSTTGVPQRSLLFLVYINDWLDMFECSVLAYADG